MTDDGLHEPSSLSHQPYRRLLSGGALAILGALVAITPRILGVDTWKIVLGLFGLALFFGAGREPRK
jgi:hypothetical protein